MTETESKDTVEKKPDDDKISKQLENDWMIRRCTVYDEEYNDCTSFKARFHQYFIHGKTIDCSQWKKDSINCYKWTDEQDLKAAQELIDSERQRRKDRLLAHYKNDIWERRKTPPEDWNKPLPEFLRKEYENSYLNIKAKELRGEVAPSFDPSVGFCSIL